MGRSVAVVLITWNSAPYLPRLAEGVKAQTHHDVEIVVVDNASADESRQLVEELLPGARLVANETNRGFSAAVNQALATVETDYVLLLNPDVFLSPGYIERLVDALEAAGPDFASATGKLLRASGHDMKPLPIIDSKGIRMTRSGRHLDIASGEEEARAGTEWGTESEPPGEPSPRSADHNVREVSPRSGQNNTRRVTTTNDQHSEQSPRSGQHSVLKSSPRSGQHSVSPTRERGDTQYAQGPAREAGDTPATDDRQLTTDNSEIFGVSGAAALHRRAMLDDVAVNGEILAESFFAYREDADLAWRARLRGWRALYVPSAVAWHVRRVLPERRGELDPLINYHSVKNRFLLRLRNEGWYLALRNAPFELTRDLMVFAATLTTERTSRSAWKWLWHHRHDVLQQRRTIQQRRRVSDRELARWFR